MARKSERADRRWSMAFPLHRAAQVSARHLDPGLGPVDPGPPILAKQGCHLGGRVHPEELSPVPSGEEATPGCIPRDVRAALLDWQLTVGVAVQDVAGGPCAGMVSALVAAPVPRTSRAAWSSRLAPVSTRAAQGEATSIMKSCMKSCGLPCSETMWPTLASGQPVRLSLKYRRPARRLLPGQLRRRPRSSAGPGAAGAGRTGPAKELMQDVSARTGVQGLSRPPDGPKRRFTPARLPRLPLTPPRGLKSRLRTKTGTAPETAG